MEQNHIVSTLILIHFDRPWLGNKIKTNCIIFQTVVPQMCSILIFWKWALDKLFHHILRTIFEKKIFSCYILSTDPFSLFGCIYLTLGNICIVIICFLVYDIINFEINLSFLITSFSYITKKTQGKYLNIIRTKRAFKVK